MAKNEADKRPAGTPDVQGNYREVGYGKPPVHTRSDGAQPHEGTHLTGNQRASHRELAWSRG
jgi:hypothetical protein